MREAINALDLDATFYPVTDRSGAEDSFRVKAKELADRYGLEGRQRFPLLHDPGADKAMYESDGEQQARARARARRMRCQHQLLERTSMRVRDADAQPHPMPSCA